MVDGSAFLRLDCRDSQSLACSFVLHESKIPLAE
jgi:hypothetical protein